MSIAPSLRLATYNLLHGLDVRRGGRLDLGAAAAGIRALSADVVALQEVDRGLDRTGGIDQLAWLAEELGFQGIFAAALLGNPEAAWSTADGDDGVSPAYGIGLLSRLPMERGRVRRLPGGGPGRRCRPASPQRPGWDHEPRVVLVADVVLSPHSPRTLRVATTHLSYLPWRGLRQLRAALRATRASRSAVEGAVLLGDLNLPVWAVRVASRRWTHVGGMPTYPAWNPRVQIDHMLMRGPMSVHEVIAAPPATSDHLPLIAEIAAT